MKRSQVFVVAVFLVGCLVLLGCNKSVEKESVEELVSRDEVIAIHDKLEEFKPRLAEVGLNYQLVDDARHEIEELKLVANGQSYSAALRAQVLTEFAGYIDLVVQKYSGKFVYFGEIPSEVLSRRSRQALERAQVNLEKLAKVAAQAARKQAGKSSER